MLEFTGVIVIDCSVITVIVVEPEIAPIAALIIVVPAANAEAKPDDAPIVATVVFEEVQVALPVMFCCEPSE